MLEQLKLLIGIHQLIKGKSPETLDLITDLDIFKSFDVDLGVTLDSIHDGSHLFKLLVNPIERPSADIWERCISAGKIVNPDDPVNAAASIYFALAAKYPINQDESSDPDTPTNIVGAPMEGLGLSADGKDLIQSEDDDEGVSLTIKDVDNSLSMLDKQAAGLEMGQPRDEQPSCT